MRLSEAILLPHNKKTIQTIIDCIDGDEKRFSELMDYFLSKDGRITQKASWALSTISQSHPSLFEPHHAKLIHRLKDPSTPIAIRRNTVRLYQFAEIPEEIESELYDLCIQYIVSMNEAIAVRAFSITVCERIAMRYPDLIPELMLCIESVIPTGSSGLKNRGHHTLKRLFKALSNK